MGISDSVIPSVNPQSAIRNPQSRDAFELSLEGLRAHPDPTTRWSEAFRSPRPLRVEIGVGNSDFLVQVALAEPGFNYLGFEYSRKRVTKFLKKVRSRGVANIRILKVNVLRVLSELVPPESVDRFFINFPDPWPKRRHAKHRLIQPPTAALLVRLLRAGGGMSLRTDSAPYAAQMLSVLDAVPDLINLAAPGKFASAPREEIRTPFELKYLKEGRSIHYLEYRKRGASGDSRS